ncbi:MAG: sulfatase-like hydrolase/transferase [Verrucomicrobiota bacterium]
MKPNLILFAGLLMTSPLPAAEKPNVLLIYGDDVGWGDISVQGAKKIQTPHIDKLATQGLRFTDGHCSAATCTPSRFSMLTGIHGFRHDVSILPPNAPLMITRSSTASVASDSNGVARQHSGMMKP